MSNSEQNPFSKLVMTKKGITTQDDANYDQALAEIKENRERLASHQSDRARIERIKNKRRNFTE